MKKIVTIMLMLLNITGLMALEEEAYKTDKIYNVEIHEFWNDTPFDIRIKVFLSDGEHGDLYLKPNQTIPVITHASCTNNIRVEVTKSPLDTTPPRAHSWAINKCGNRTTRIGWDGNRSLMQSTSIKVE